MMNPKKYIVMPVAILMMAVNAIAQTQGAMITSDLPSENSSSDKATLPAIDFIYHGKPISPLTLMPLFPSEQDSSSQTVVDLSRPALYRASFDTIWSSSLTWLRRKQRKSAYTCIMDYGFISYIVLGKASANRYVIFGCINAGDRSLTRYYVFVLDKEGDKLVKTGGFKTDNSRDSAILLKGNTIIDHEKPYLIPAEKSK
jgi:hypothetical protein